MKEFKVIISARRAGKSEYLRKIQEADARLFGHCCPEEGKTLAALASRKKKAPLA